MDEAGVNCVGGSLDAARFGSSVSSRAHTVSLLARASPLRDLSDAGMVETYYVWSISDAGMVET